VADEKPMKRDREKPPSVGDLLGITENQGNNSPLLRISDVPTDVREWAAMGRQSPRQRRSMLAVVAEDMAIRDGYIDSQNVMWLNFAMQIGDNGEGRREYLSGMGAAVDRESTKWGMMSRFFNRRSPDENGGPGK
jgi:hypothetical protein